MNNELSTLLQAMEEAGKAILTLQKTNFTISKKVNNDIVTQADLIANDILREHLLKSFPNDGWLSEESVDDAHRLTRERVWVVDPIDGTKEFAESVPEYAISVALVEKGIPIVSSVYNPAANELFYAVKGEGAWLNHHRINCINHLSNDFLFLASRSEYKRGEWNRFEEHYEVKQVGSIAYKLALIASGYADATFSLGPKNEWDVAAGVLLVIEAGGKVSNKEREQILFNRQDVKVNGIIATSSTCYEQVLSLIERMPPV